MHFWDPSPPGERAAGVTHPHCNRFVFLFSSLAWGSFNNDLNKAITHVAVHVANVREDALMVPNVTVIWQNNFLSIWLRQMTLQL